MFFTMRAAAFVVVFCCGSITASAYYDPGMQRWLNRDPIQEYGGENLFVFVKNAPIMRFDPKGLLNFGPIITPVSGLVCAIQMKYAHDKAIDWINANNDKYVCYNCDPDKTKMTDQDGFAVGHCLAGYYAKQAGASKSCLAAGNAANEIYEIWKGTTGQDNVWDWAGDTGSDVGYTYGGYDYATSPESCIPHNCKKEE
jgi:hypothetical protein